MQGFKKTPTVHVTVQHTKKDRKYDAMLVWIENISPSEFEVCLQESRVFDGLHEGLIVVSRYSVYVLLNRLFCVFHWSIYFPLDFNQNVFFSNGLLSFVLT